MFIQVSELTSLTSVDRKFTMTDYSISKAPEPLLANYGMARVRIYQQDINMMSFLNSKERTLQEFIDMG